MQSSSDDQAYDYRIFPTTLSGLNKGWNISIRSGFNYSESKNKSAIYIPIFGLKSSGKSWFLSKLQGMKDIPHGSNKPTKGLCIKYSSDSPDVCPAVYIDTHPFSKFLSTSELDLKSKNYSNELEDLKLDHLCAEKLLVSYLSSIATMLVLVINELTYETQYLLTELENSLQKKPNLTLVVVHNLYLYQNVEQVQNKIKEELIAGLGLQEGQWGYVSKSSNQVIHLIMACEDSEAGRIYNPETIEFLQKKINITSPSTVDFFGGLQTYLKEKLKIFYEHPEVEKLVLNDDKIYLDSNKKGEILRPPYVPLDRVESNIATARAFVNEENKTLTIQVLTPGNIEIENVKMKHEKYLDKYRIHMKIPRKVYEQKEKELFNTLESESKIIEIVTPFISANDYSLVDFKKKKLKLEDGYLYATWTYKKGEDGWE